MKSKYLAAIFVSLTLLAYPAYPSESDDASVYRDALELYGKGLYPGARVLFESVDDPLCRAYALLCAVKQKDPGFPASFAGYRASQATGILDSELHFRYACNLFDEGNYAMAASEYDMVRVKDISRDDLPEFWFKRAFCDFQAGKYADASKKFETVIGLQYSEYTASSQYYLGYMAYQEKRVADARKWFEKSVADRRFSELSSFYLIECHFLEGDYDYVIREGEASVDKVPVERSAHLSRLISESYLVKGDAKKAREYYDRENAVTREMTRSDYFHAGSVMYGVGDFGAAIDAFTKMTDRTDSLGQIASYQLGYSYVRKGNKVSALSAFNDAASLPFNPSIQEDAAFNYAKLAFDINHDTEGFKAYLAKYSTREKGEMVYSYIALAELYNKDYDAAIAAYDNIETLSEIQKGNYVKANYLRARELVTAESWSKAVPYLKAAGFYYPKTNTLNQLSRYWLGESYYNTGDYASAANVFSDLYNNSALQRNAEGEFIPYNLAYAFFRQENYQSSARWFDTYLSSGNVAAKEDAMNRVADCYFLQKDYKTASQKYLQAGEARPEADNVYPYYREGLCYGLMGNRNKKLSTLLKVKSASPSAPYYSEAMYELGRTFLDKGSASDAVAVFDTLRVNSPDSTYVARAFIGLGMSHRNQKKYSAALADYKQVVTMMPGSEYAREALTAIESIYQTIGQPEKYLAYVEQSNLLTGKSEEEKEQIYFNTAEQVYLAGNFTGAVSQLRKYCEDYPTGANVGKASFYIADSYRQTGDKERAVEWYLKVPGLIPDSSFAEISLLQAAELSYSLENFTEAYNCFGKLADAAKIDENRQTGIVGMMRSAYKSKNYESAVSCADKVAGSAGVGGDLRREALYLKAKSLLSVSRREEAMSVFSQLSAAASTPEGAESAYILIQNTYDSGDFSAVEPKVYDFAKNCGTQNYWLAKAFIVLGDSFVERGNLQQAKATFESVRDGYSPSGESDDVPENVRFRLEKLQSLM